ncbi:hypothetical protein ACLOJK_016981 [Asimina triloba]
MAHLGACPNCPTLVTQFQKYPPPVVTVAWAYKRPEIGKELREVGCLELRQKSEIVGGSGGRRKGSFLLFRSNSNSSPAGGVSVVGEDGEDGESGSGEGQFGHLVSEHGWHVRRLVEEEEEMRRVAKVQAEAFHVPVAVFNDFFFQFFQAEVLAALIYRLRNSPPNRYACLVAEPADDFDSLHPSQKELVGVVDVTVMREEAVLRHMEGSEEYLYVSGIAVLPDFRRQKVATALLKACDLLSLIWGFDYLALRAYEDDWGARKLYSNAGYRVVSGDPRWMTSWVGRKRRVLMIKQSGLGKRGYEHSRLVLRQRDQLPAAVASLNLIKEQMPHRLHK